MHYRLWKAKCQKLYSSIESSDRQVQTLTNMTGYPVYFCNTEDLRKSCEAMAKDIWCTVNRNDDSILAVLQVMMRNKWQQNAFTYI